MMGSIVTRFACWHLEHLRCYCDLYTIYTFNDAKHLKNPLWACGSISLALSEIVVPFVQSAYQAAFSFTPALYSSQIQLRLPVHHVTPRIWLQTL